MARIGRWKKPRRLEALVAVVVEDVLDDQVHGPEVHRVVGLKLEAVAVKDVLVLE